MAEPNKTTRRTLAFIKKYPKPSEILGRLQNNQGWNYKRNREKYVRRDRALVALLYLVALRISEALRLRKKQFKPERQRVVIESIMLSKSHIKVCSECGARVKPELRQEHLNTVHSGNGFFKDKMRKSQYRPEAWLPLKGERSQITQYVLDYLDTLKEDDLLFPLDRKRAWQIVTALMGEPPHWHRAFGEDYLYSEVMDHDIMAVSDYVKVDARTLQLYLRKGYEKYKTRFA
jgi:integrase